MRLRARRRLPYAGKTYQAGEEFEASEADARLLVAAGSCEPLEAMPSGKPKPAKQQRVKPGRYQRRDLRAESP